MAEIPEYVDRLRRRVAAAVPALLAIDAEASARRPAPDRWSPREIVGHLVDSASNNHQRFVRAQIDPDLAYDGYAQDLWVDLQRYREAPWGELVELWRAFNGHLARVMEAVPDEVRLRSRVRLNLHEIGFTAVPAGAPASLDQLMRDYVDHLEHHLRQIFG